MIAETLTLTIDQISWSDIAQLTGYKEGKVANTRFARIKKKMNWGTEAALQEGMTKAKRAAVNMDKDPPEKGSPAKRQRRQVKQEAKNETAEDEKQTSKLAGKTNTPQATGESDHESVE